MTHSKQGLALTERFEGCKLEAYQDSKGVWTLGYGHTHGVHEGMGCNQAQAEAWLADDTAWAERVVNALVLRPLTQGEFDALVDFAFNVGSGNLQRSTLLRVLNAGHLDEAAAEFEAWDKSGGKVVAGLERRREAEEKEFESIS